MKRINFTCPIVFGVTGPTGSGKSRVTGVLWSHGAAVVDADRIAREVFDLYPECVRELAAAFGADIVQYDGTVDRKTLAARAFFSAKRTACLNEITHPYIRSLMVKRLFEAQEKKKNFIVLDAPLLFEAELNNVCHRTIAVIAPREVRLARIMERDHLSEAAALTRMARQPDDDFYISRATDVLYNDKDLDALDAAAEDLLSQFTQEYACLLTEEDACHE